MIETLKFRIFGFENTLDALLPRLPGLQAAPLLRSFAAHLVDILLGLANRSSGVWVSVCLSKPEIQKQEATCPKQMRSWHDAEIAAGGSLVWKGRCHLLFFS